MNSHSRQTKRRSIEVRAEEIPIKLFTYTQFEEGVNRAFAEIFGTGNGSREDRFVKISCPTRPKEKAFMYVDPNVSIDTIYRGLITGQAVQAWYDNISAGVIPPIIMPDGVPLPFQIRVPLQEEQMLELVRDQCPPLFTHEVQHVAHGYLTKNQLRQVSAEVRRRAPEQYATCRAKIREQIIKEGGVLHSDHITADAVDELLAETRHLVHQEYDFVLTPYLKDCNAVRQLESLATLIPVMDAIALNYAERKGIPIHNAAYNTTARFPGGRFELKSTAKYGETKSGRFDRPEPFELKRVLRLAIA